MRTTLPQELKVLESLDLAKEIKTKNFKVLNETLRRIVVASNPTEQAVHALGLKGGVIYLVTRSTIKSLQKGEGIEHSPTESTILDTILKMLSRWSMITVNETLAPFPVNLKDLDIIVLKFNDIRTKSVVKFDYKNNLST